MSNLLEMPIINDPAFDEFYGIFQFLPFPNKEYSLHDDDDDKFICPM